MKTSTLKPEFLIAPGYYMQFWSESVLGNYTHHQILSNPFKPYRELWVGAPIAALYNKYLKDGMYFVQMPERDPPDVWITRIYENESPLRREGYARNKLAVEVTRCDLDAGEDPLEQIQAKNSPAYQDVALALYLTGMGKEYDLTLLHLQLQRLKIYVSEVKVVSIVEKMGKLHLPGVQFMVTNVYPEYTQAIMELSDEAAFRTHPAIIIQGKKSYNRTWTDNGKFRLIPPI